MTGRITTRAGRKIRQCGGAEVGHWIDVATGIRVIGVPDGWIFGVGGPITKREHPVFDAFRTLNDALRVISRAEAVCTLVRYLVLSWQETRAGSPWIPRGDGTFDLDEGL